MINGKCKLCLKDTRLCKSHIIPEFMFEKNNILVSDTIPYPMRRKTGIYDTILCGDCEAYLNKEFENDAKIMLFDKPRDRVYFDSHNSCYRLKNKNDYYIIDKFFISVLWRASVSSKAEFKKINLGCYEQIARQAILEKGFNFAKFFTITLVELYDLKYKLTIICKRRRFKGVNFYIFTAGSIKVLMRCDKQRHPVLVDQDVLMHKQSLSKHPTECSILRGYTNIEKLTH